MTLQTEDCRLKINGLLTDRLSIGATLVASGWRALARSNRQSAIAVSSIFILQSSIGNEEWVS
jgi:hypothetical protein